MFLLKHFWRLNRYSLVTVFSALSLQYQMYRFTGILYGEEEQGVYDYYFFTTGLLFFSMIFIYNLDHFLDKFLFASLPLNQSTSIKAIRFYGDYPIYVLVLISSLLGIGFLFFTGWEIWDIEFIKMGGMLILLCGIHFLIFHTQLRNTFFLFKELSVTIITVIGITTPLVYYEYIHNKDINSLIDTFAVMSLVVFLLMGNSVLFYSWTRIEDDRKQKIQSLFHFFSFVQAKRLLLSLAFFSVLTLLLLKPQSFSVTNARDVVWYFLSVAIVEGVMVQVNQEKFSQEKLRFISEVIFLVLLPFFLW